jgi:hypothetical protein
MLGPDCQGSLELGHSSGAVFWLPYREFQKYCYGTFVDNKSPSSSQQALVVSQVAMLAHRHLPLACTLSSQA